MTFDVIADVLIGRRYDWQSVFEICANCRQCSLPSLFRVELRDSKASQVFAKSGTILNFNSDISALFAFERNVGLADAAAQPTPEGLPDDIAQAFDEGAKCLAISCYNAASAMFRLCLDLATKGLLPPEGGAEGPNKQARRNLSPRLRWLFESKTLPGELRDLSDAVKSNGDDGAHDGILTREDAEDIYDFAFSLLERLYTEPARLAAATQRRLDRHKPKA